MCFLLQIKSVMDSEIWLDENYINQQLLLFTSVEIPGTLGHEDTFVLCVSGIETPPREALKMTKWTDLTL